ncbi:MmgE/PrpD family protein [Variovorax sp. EBFNA2]|uniref:MmgE/PrpD family protein n=1 Tax=Variovorax sp. EBFNA2 TaxID=3342097 RepID=UPI0029C04E63|nr:MmgE/PrpD family protein [Variovorax boronicumulans]WPG41203.1 MmgE/PrpD family protein [Variovorax boronicumulans]
MQLAEKLAEYVDLLQYSDLGQHVIHVAKQRVVDSMGCALGGMNSAPATSTRSYAHTLPQGASTIFFSRKKVATDVAAFLNATMVRFLDYNDGYFSLEPGHPSDSIAACLAVAEAENLSGKDVILSMVIAYEIQMRFQDAATLFRRGWDHVNYVTIAATMAVGKLLKLSRPQLVHALGMALNGHIAMRQVRSGELSGWKGASAANATRNAVFCAYLAKHDMTGPCAIFEGEMGFFAQVSGAIDLDTAYFGNRQSQDFRIKVAKTKLYPTNGEMQTAVMAAVSLREKIGSLDAIESIRVDTTDVGYKFLAKDKAKWRPETRETADHSLPYTVARALLDGTITRATYDVAKLADPQVLAIIDKITVHEDPVLAAQMPSLANRVTLRLKNGESLSEELGTKENPRIGLDDRAIETKFRDFAQEHFSQQKIEEALGLCWALDQQAGLHQFLSNFELDVKS